MVERQRTAPADAPRDPDLLHGSLVSTIAPVIRDDPDSGRVGSPHIFQPLRHERQAVRDDEEARRRRERALKIDDNRVGLGDLNEKLSLLSDI